MKLTHKRHIKKTHRTLKKRSSLAKTKRRQPKKSVGIKKKTQRKRGGVFFRKFWNPNYEKDLMIDFYTNSDKDDKIKERFNGELFLLVQMFKVCILYCYKKETKLIQTTSIEKWSNKCIEHTEFCKKFFEQNKKVEKIVNIILKNENISLDTKNYIANKYNNVIIKIETERESFISSNEKNKFNVEEKNKLNLTERDIFLKKNEEDILNLFMDEEYQYIELQKTNSNRDILDLKQLNLIENNKTNENIKKLYEDILAQNNIGEKTKDKIKMIHETALFLTKQETNLEIILDFLSEYIPEKLKDNNNIQNFLKNEDKKYKFSKPIDEKYEIFEKYNKIMQTQSSMNESIQDEEVVI